MSKKAKIELIIKILLILVFVPVGVVSWAWSETPKGNPFVEDSFSYQLHYEGWPKRPYNQANQPDTDNYSNAWNVLGRK